MEWLGVHPGSADLTLKLKDVDPAEAPPLEANMSSKVRPLVKQVLQRSTPKLARLKTKVCAFFSADSNIDSLLGGPGALSTGTIVVNGLAMPLSPDFCLLFLGLPLGLPSIVCVLCRWRMMCTVHMQTGPTLNSSTARCPATQTLQHCQVHISRKSVCVQPLSPRSHKNGE